MSEYNPSYRIVTTESTLQKRIMLVFYTFVIANVFIAPDLFSFMWAVKLLIIMPLARTALRQYQQPSPIYTFNLIETGKIELSEMAKGQQVWSSFDIQRFSLFCDWFCLLRLKSDSPLDVVSNQNKRHIWIWRDGVDDDSYRRICRVIARVRSGG